MEIPATLSEEALYRAGLTPLTIGVTGHRDLVEAEVPQIRLRIEALLVSLQRRCPDRPLRILSALAEGADRIVADVALKLGVDVTAVLPMPADLYRLDFTDEGSAEQFDRLCEQAVEVLELPIISEFSREQLSKAGKARNLQYARLGIFLCAHSHVLLALWDGKPSDELGGTAQVVRFHHHDIMEGFSAPDEINPQILADDESDLVYQIVVSRRRENGEPRAGLKPLDAFWLTTDEDNPYTPTLPEQYATIFERTNEFNQDAKRFARRICAECSRLISGEAAQRLPPSLRLIDAFFCAADWLAIYYQRRFVNALKYTHALAFAMALMFLLYSDAISSELFVFILGACSVLAFSVHRVAARRKWQAKYLEYRTLAEGLRVQLYWAAAGVTSASTTKYAHDNFLQKQDIELAWIRNVMRVSGMTCDVSPNLDPGGLAFVLKEWIGEESQGGQLKYYQSKAHQHIRRSRRIDTMGKIVGFSAMVLLAGAVAAPTEHLRTALVVLLAILLLLVSIREAYASRAAEKEVVRQYEFMYRIFHNARKRLAGADTDAHRKRILRILGEAALDEHAEWILLHRERPLEESQVWRMHG